MKTKFPVILRHRAIIASLIVILSANLAFPGSASANQNELPDKVVSTFLSSPNRVTLYSIEPIKSKKENFHGYKILGKTRLDTNETASIIADLQKAMAHPHGIGMCFEPHHALRVEAGGHTYDLVICFLCGEVDVYENDSTNAGKEMAELSLAGSPDLINGIANKHGLPTPKILIQHEEEEQKRQKEDEHWLSVMPKSIRPLWDEKMRGYLPLMPQFDLKPMGEALKEEFPNDRQQILALFAWYGSAGWRSGYHAYELVPSELLHSYDYSDLLSIAQSDQLTEPQLEGAARYFASDFIDEKERHNQHALVDGIKKHRQEVDQWLSVMPSSIRPLWKNQFWYHGCGSGHKLTDEETNSMLDALSKEFSDKNQQILALFNWYGGGLGIKRNACNYEIIADDLLQHFTTPELGEALQSTKLSEYQLNGADRLFTDFFYQRDHPHEVSKLPPPLKAILLAHIKESDNQVSFAFTAELQ